MKARQSGVAIVEFALTLPLLLLLTMITTEFGRAIYQYNTIVKSVRGAARYLAVQTPGTVDAAAITAATNLVVYGTPSPSGTETPLVPGLTVDKVAPPTWQTAGSVPLINTVTITVTDYTFQPLVRGSIFGIGFGDITFHDITATMRCPS